MKTFLFYDVETTGLNPAFDQILTFACIRTDLLLNEIDRQTITLQLRKDIVPSPMAFFTHGLTLKDLTCGITEYKAARKIHHLVNTPGTVSLGYNSLGFDDEFLRFLFYRNLLDPYAHQYSNSCSRMDILPITTLYKVFNPGILNWPQIQGNPSLKLDLLAQENHFVTSGRAHEAMNDVEALIGLTKRLYVQKDIWEYCLDFFHKKRDEIRIQNFEKGFDLNGERLIFGILVSASFGPKVNYIAPAVNIGFSAPYKNQGLWLRLDSDDILSLDENLSFEDTFVTRKRFGDVPIVLPMLERFQSKMTLDVSKKMEDNIKKIQENPDRFFSFINYHRDFKYPYVPQIDMDADLYQGGFFSKDEKNQIQAFHSAFDHGDKNIFEHLKSPRVHVLAKRIIARNCSDLFDFQNEAENILRLDALRNKKNQAPVIGYRNDTKLTCADALAELDSLGQELLTPTPDQTQMLSWLRRYIENL
ncbi:MAG: exodeoxyribonuclease I [Proteobacteria bacterium]|nr:exodeoxyribonuclease I [Pseudomonadota bacterium]MBU1389440.1 exodeoxyribonuclease I [Pseudomonadota bacterium]MBU1541260.1 exodeoxyribonuclease I [Pseudomonadota bacterium]MBU2429883.1 exodeoxyribonuclease I [Pseudomonadota bacterium]